MNERKERKHDGIRNDLYLFGIKDEMSSGSEKSNVLHRMLSLSLSLYSSLYSKELEREVPPFCCHTEIVIDSPSSCEINHNEFSLRCEECVIFGFVGKVLHFEFSV